jgi:hypothetical protein
MQNQVVCFHSFVVMHLYKIIFVHYFTRTEFHTQRVNEKKENNRWKGGGKKVNTHTKVNNEENVLNFVNRNWDYNGKISVALKCFIKISSSAICDANSSKWNAALMKLIFTFNKIPQQNKID